MRSHGDITHDASGRRRLRTDAGVVPEQLSEQREHIILLMSPRDAVTFTEGFSLYTTGVSGMLFNSQLTPAQCAFSVVDSTSCCSHGLESSPPTTDISALIALHGSSNCKYYSGASLLLAHQNVLAGGGPSATPVDNNVPALLPSRGARHNAALTSTDFAPRRPDAALIRVRQRSRSRRGKHGRPLERGAHTALGEGDSIDSNPQLGGDARADSNCHQEPIVLQTEAQALSPAPAFPIRRRTQQLPWATPGSENTKRLLGRRVPSMQVVDATILGLHCWSSALLSCARMATGATLRAASTGVPPPSASTQTSLAPRAIALLRARIGEREVTNTASLAASLSVAFAEAALASLGLTRDFTLIAVEDETRCVAFGSDSYDADLERDSALHAALVADPVLVAQLICPLSPPQPSDATVEMLRGIQFSGTGGTSAEFSHRSASADAPLLLRAPAASDALLSTRRWDAVMAATVAVGDVTSLTSTFRVPAVASGDIQVNRGTRNAAPPAIAAVGGAILASPRAHSRAAALRRFRTQSGVTPNRTSHSSHAVAMPSTATNVADAGLTVQPRPPLACVEGLPPRMIAILERLRRSYWALASPPDSRNAPAARRVVSDAINSCGEAAVGSASPNAGSVDVPPAATARALSFAETALTTTESPWWLWHPAFDPRSFLWADVPAAVALLASVDMGKYCDAGVLGADGTGSGSFIETNTSPQVLSPTPAIMTRSAARCGETRLASTSPLRRSRDGVSSSPFQSPPRRFPQRKMADASAISHQPAPDVAMSPVRRTRGSLTTLAMMSPAACGTRVHDNEEPRVTHRLSGACNYPEPVEFSAGAHRVTPTLCGGDILVTTGNRAASPTRRLSSGGRTTVASNAPPTSPFCEPRSGTSKRANHARHATAGAGMPRVVANNVVRGDGVVNLEATRGRWRDAAAAIQRDELLWWPWVSTDTIDAAALGAGADDACDRQSESHVRCRRRFGVVAAAALVREFLREALAIPIDALSVVPWAPHTVPDTAIKVTCDLAHPRNATAMQRRQRDGKLTISSAAVGDTAAQCVTVSRSTSIAPLPSYAKLRHRTMQLMIRLLLMPAERNIVQQASTRKRRVSRSPVRQAECASGLIRGGHLNNTMMPTLREGVYENVRALCRVATDMGILLATHSLRGASAHGLPFLKRSSHEHLRTNAAPVGSGGELASFLTAIALEPFGERIPSTVAQLYATVELPLPPILQSLDVHCTADVNSTSPAMKRLKSLRGPRRAGTVPDTSGAATSSSTLHEDNVTLADDVLTNAHGRPNVTQFPSSSPADGANMQTSRSHKRQRVDGTRPTDSERAVVTAQHGAERAFGSIHEEATAVIAPSLRNAFAARVDEALAPVGTAARPLQMIGDIESNSRHTPRVLQTARSLPTPTRTVIEVNAAVCVSPRELSVDSMQVRVAQRCLDDSAAVNAVDVSHPQLVRPSARFGLVAAQQRRLPTRHQPRVDELAASSTGSSVTVARNDSTASRPPSPPSSGSDPSRPASSASPYSRSQHAMLSTCAPGSAAVDANAKVGETVPVLAANTVAISERQSECVKPQHGAPLSSAAPEFASSRTSRASAAAVFRSVHDPLLPRRHNSALLPAVRHVERRRVQVVLQTMVRDFRR